MFHKKSKYILFFLFFLLGCNSSIKGPEQEFNNSLIGAWVVNTDQSSTWIYKIGYQGDSNIIGNKVIYGLDKPLIIPFTGSFDSTNWTIKIEEKKHNSGLSGIFEGSVSNDAKKLSGNWKSYKGNEQSLILLKDNKNYNSITSPSKCNFQVSLIYSEAIYNGQFGVSSPQFMLITPDYRANIGNTFFAGSYQKNEQVYFYIHVKNTGMIYDTENYDHASIVELSDQKWRIYFEDSEDKKHRDFNDLIVDVEATPSSDSPCLIYPVSNSDAPDGYHWGIASNPFGNYLVNLHGYHPGEDWNLIGGEPDDDLHKPVYAISDGIVKKCSKLGELGYLIEIKHYAPEGYQFIFPAKSFQNNNKNFRYSTDYVEEFTSASVHLELAKRFTEGEEVNQGDVLGYIMDSGYGPHLHFEIRHPNAISSNDGSLVGEPSNWATYADGKYTGYYLDPQKMVDSGLREPSSFIEANNSLHRKP